MQLKALRGTADLFSPVIEKWREVETVARELFKVYGFKEIQTPLLEETLLFTRAVGETTDLVEKQMYSFTDRGERSVTLRPEGTAPVIRAYLEHHLDQQPGIHRLFYIGAMFRAERPQAGRSRQFHQIGGEAIGSYDARVDAEILSLIVHLFGKLGLSGYALHLNSLGCSKDKVAVSAFLQKALLKEKSALCDDCQKRLERNAYRILDCKVERCRDLVKKLPPILDKLCKECLTHFEGVQKNLALSKIDFTLSPHLVRGLDYYTRTAFEITHPMLGAQDAVGAGGRYDGLVEGLGGKPTGAIGFSIGFERLLLALEAQKIEVGKGDPLEVFVVTIGEKTTEAACAILTALRKAGISSLLDYEGKSLKAQMRLADHLHAKRVVLIGEDELKEKKVTLKEMATGREEKISQEGLSEELSLRIAKGLL